MQSPDSIVTVNTVTIENVPDDVAELQARLLEAARISTGAPTLQIRGAFTPITGGFDSKIYSVEFANAPTALDRALVLRVMPDTTRAAHEIAVHRTLADQGYLVPAVRLADPTVATLGSPYMLMDRAPGGPLLANLSLGRAITILPRILATLPSILATSLIELHQLDPEPVRAALAATGIPKPQGTASLLAPLLESPGVAHVKTLQRAVEWLQEHEPPIGRAVVCHGDLHPLNIIAIGTDVTAIIDWTGARLADPAFDVACTAVLIGQAPLAAPKPIQPILRAIGRSLARRFVKQYRKKMPLDDAQLQWHEAWQCTRALAEVANWRLVGAEAHAHPFEISLAGLTRHLQQITGIEVTLPPASRVITEHA